MTVSIYIPFAVDPHDDAVNIKRDRQSRIDIYFKVMQCAFASIARFSPSVNATLVTNLAPPMHLQEFLSEHGFRVSITPFTHDTRGASYKSFNASFYMLDAMKHVAETAEDAGPLIFLDPDCLILQDLSAVAIKDDEVLALPLHLSENDEMNGMSPREAATCSQGLIRESPNRRHIHYGGEFYATSLTGLRNLVSANEQLWNGHLERLQKGLASFTTEEHLISASLTSEHTQGGSSAEHIVARLWTTARVSNWRSANQTILVAHLPAEKDSAFVWLFPYTSQGDSWFWTNSDPKVKSRLKLAFGLLPFPIGNVINLIRRSLILPRLHSRN